MEITIPPLTREIIEYVFVFNSGMELSFIVDPKAGDTFNELSDKFVIVLSDKPNQFDEADVVPGEEITILKEPLAVMQKRKRTQRMPSQDELLDFSKMVLAKSPKTVQ